MSTQRGLLYIALAVISFFLYQAWDKDYGPKPAVVNKVETTNTTDIYDQTRLFHIKNDILDLTINLDGGDIVKANLLKYYKTLENKEYIDLLDHTKDRYFVILSGLYGAQGTDIGNSRAKYEIADNQVINNKQVVTLKYTNNNIDYIKTITVNNTNYEIDVDYKITNNASSNISLGSFARLIKKPSESSGSFFTPSTYSGAIVSTEEDKYDKVKYSKILSNEFKPLVTNNGWIAISDSFFLGAWIPPQNVENRIQASKLGDDFATLSVLSKEQIVAPGQTISIDNKVWIGPKLQNQLATVEESLPLTVDYGWAWFIAKPLFTLLSWLQSFIHNWGFAIIALTIVVRIILFPLSRIQFRTQAKMRILAPDLALVNQRHGDDRLAKMKETQKIYRDNKVSPLGGCLPLLIQMPIFLALFYVFSEAVELRHTPWIYWIKDLSSSDPYFILPIINGVSMILLMRMTPTPEGIDPLQKKLMTYMPYAFVIFFLFLPSGLVLYYSVSNIITILMMKYIYWSVGRTFKKK